jgi:Uma2 family endonuclease
MVEAGVLDEKERLELIDGALLKMPSEGDDHRAAKAALNHFFVTQAGSWANVLLDSTLYLDEDVFTEPDVYLWSLDTRLSELRGSNVWLVVEAAKTSVRRDLGEKADLYARYGVREYWVVDLAANRVVVHRTSRSTGGWAERQEHGPDEVITPLALPDVQFSLQRLRWPLL